MTHRTPRRLRPLAVGALLIATGCQSTWYNARFTPAPVEAQVIAAGEPLAQARVLATVLGIRRPDAEASPQGSVEVRMMVENLGATAATLDPDWLQLVDAELHAFADPRVTPAPGAIEPGASETYDVSFPLGEVAYGDYALSGLNLRWRVVFDERSVTAGANFERYQRSAAYPGYYDPYFYDPFFAGPRYRFGFGWRGCYW